MDRTLSLRNCLQTSLNACAIFGLANNKRIAARTTVHKRLFRYKCNAMDTRKCFIYIKQRYAFRYLFEQRTLQNAQAHPELGRLP